MTLYRPIRKSIYRLLGKPFYKRRSVHVLYRNQRLYRVRGVRIMAIRERERIAAYQDATRRDVLMKQGIRARQRFDKQQARMKAEAVKKEKAAAKRAKEAEKRFQRACKRQKQQQQQQLEETIPEQHTVLTELFTGFNLVD